jgi:hypothetical protein
MSALARDIRESLVDVRALLDALGIPSRREGRGYKVSCPAHRERTPSCSIWLAGDGTIAGHCHGCGWSADALGLVALVHGLQVRRDFPHVLRRAAEIAGRWDLVADLRARDGFRDSRSGQERKRRLVSPAPEPTYPASDEVAALLAACVDVASDADVCAMLRLRGLDPEWIDDARLARVIPLGAILPTWARYHGQSWTDLGHRLVLPVVDPIGEIRSVRAWRIGDGNSPKRLPPSGRKAAGLVLADDFAVAMLRGTYEPRRVIVVEGEPDFLTACSRTWGYVLAARIGIGSGAWSDKLAAKIPSGADVALWTDADERGDEYAGLVERSLRGRCRVLRAAAEEVAE